MSSPFRELSPRQRKSRSGCKRCKVRKIKCDEGLPSCHQCQRRGFVCPGYNKNLQWVQHHELSGSRLRVTTKTRNRPVGQVAEAQPILVAPSQDLGVWPGFLNVLGVQELEVTQDLFLPEPSITYPTQDRRPSICDQTSLDLWKLEPNDIQDILQCFTEDYEHDFIIEPPSHSRSILPSLQDTTTFFIEYYFSNVCPLLSCFDSPSNPFRFEISNMIRTSPALSNCIQAMSAAHLSQLQPSRQHEGLKFQNAALRSISDSVSSLAEVTDDLMIAVILLGVTQPWHDRHATGIEHFAGARTLCAPWLMKQITRGPSAQIDFIISMLIYWEMLASFVMKDATGLIECLESYHFETLASSLTIPASDSSSSTSSYGPIRKRRPHPITGATPEIFILFAKVGHLVRTRTLELHAMGSSIYASDDKWDHCHWSTSRPKTPKEVEEVEEALLTYEILSVEDVECTNDTRTPVADLLHMAEAYRCAALLQLYRAFPSLLRMRLRLSSASAQDQDQSDSSRPLPGENANPISSPSDTCSESFSAPDDPADQFLFALATQILKSVAQTSTGSGTRTIMPLILVMAANELRLPMGAKSALDDRDTDTDDGEEPEEEEEKAEKHAVAYWRRFLWSRLNGCIRYLSVQPMTTTLDIVKALWTELDSGRRVFWLEVILENGWETLLG